MNSCNLSNLWKRKSYNWRLLWRRKVSNLRLFLFIWWYVSDYRMKNVFENDYMLQTEELTWIEAFSFFILSFFFFLFLLRNDSELNCSWESQLQCPEKQNLLIHGQTHRFWSESIGMRPKINRLEITIITLNKLQ